MQKCGGADANLFLTGGASGYNGPVSCDVFFAYPWWITFYNLTAIGISIAALLGFMQRFRPGVMALLSISLMQNLDTANTFLFYNDVETTSGSFNSSARVTAAGAIIKSISMFFLLGLIGTRDESVTQYERPAKQKSKAAAPAERV